jgi:O-antigen/teichoic acid export membrane protein
MRKLLQLDGGLDPTMWLIIGRALGLVAAFVAPLVLVRFFDQTTFGTYKQLFLIYGTLFGLAQVGVAESLYYFVPRSAADAGKHALNAAITLGLVGLGCVGLLFVFAGAIANWFNNPAIGTLLLPLGLFLTLMLMTAPFEIVMVSRHQYRTAAFTYAASDIIRASFMILPALLIGGLQGVLWGAVAFGVVRLITMCGAMARDFGRSLRPSLALWRQQWIYTLPFALAVTMEVVQTNLHQYVVGSRFSPMMFAIYAVGCLQIPFVDVIATSTANVMMVKMAEAGFDRRGREALDLWHTTMCRLALVIFPLAVFLMVMARDIIIVLFTPRYLESVPIFRLWTSTIIFSVLCVDAVLRANAHTRLLLALNVLRLSIVAIFISALLTYYGLNGAVLVTLLATAVVRIIGIVRIGRFMDAGVRDVLPWAQLTKIAAFATIAAVPAYFIAQSTNPYRLTVLLSAGAAYAVIYGALCFLPSGTRDHVRNRWNHPLESVAR